VLGTINFAGDDGVTVATNAASELAYGVSVLRVDTLLSNNTQAQDLADFYSNKFGEPLLRVTSLQIPVDRLQGTNLGAVLGLDLGDQVTVRFTPNGIGDPLLQTVVVESIEHSISPGRHDMRLTLSQSLAGFILDTSRLDIDGLGF
jgi:hypothetical protein